MANQISLTVEKEGTVDVTNYTMLFTVSKIKKVRDNTAGTKGLVSYPHETTGETILYTVTELAAAIKIASDSVEIVDTEISVDTINESTPDAGVTIDGVLMKDGKITTTGQNLKSVSASITAKVGGGQDATLALTKDINIVLTVATAADSVTLPTAVAGQEIIVANLGANALAVFPYTSDSIDDAAADASITVAPEEVVTFISYTGIKWQSSIERIGAAVDVVTDTITERTAGAGVTIDSVVLKDGGVTSTIPNVYANATTITAFATGGQASAVALTKEFNDVTTVATAGDSVKLPAAATGLKITVKNSGAAALDIFPAASDSIDALAINLAVRIQPGSVITFYAKDAIVWESDRDQSLTLSAPTTVLGQLEIKAADSAGNTVTTITNASQAAARTYTIPDAGASASFAMTEGAQTINGAKTFGTGIAVPDGLVSALSVRIGADGNNGIYGVSDTQMGLAVEGTLVATADTSGLTADSLRNRVNLGTAGTNCTVVEYADGRDITAVITITAAVLGAPTAGGNSAHGAAIYTFPAGAHVTDVTYMSVGLTAGGVTTDTPDVGIGSVVGSGAVAVLSDVGATSEDYITGQTAADSAGTATVQLVKNTTGIGVNKAADVKAVYLNAADGWDAGVTGDLTATGTVSIKWTKMS